MKVNILTSRVALATVRNKGYCLCPQCTIHTDRVHNLGMKRDRKDRVSKTRKDTTDLHVRVEKARDAIYMLNRPVDSSLVEKELKDESYIPTRVC